MQKAFKFLGYVVAVFLIVSAGAEMMEAAPPPPQPEAGPLVEQALRHLYACSDSYSGEVSRALRTMKAIVTEELAYDQLQTDSSDEYPSFLWYAVFVAVVLSALAAYMSRRKG
jgi:hypothetical protein